MQVRADRNGPLLVAGVDETIEPFRSVDADRQQAYVIDRDEIVAEDAGNDTGDGIGGPGGAHGRAEVLDPEPRDPHAGFDFVLAEGLDGECGSGHGRAANDEVLFPPDPFQGPRRLQCWCGDLGKALVPGG